MHEKDLNKFKGCLYGGAIGDALGYAVEFLNIEQIREYDRTRGKEKERMATSAIISKRWAKRDSRIMSAHSKVSRAIRSGLLEKKSCVICGTTKSYAHHESYNRPLDVVWYCQVHHKARHKEITLAGIDPLLLIDEENN